MRFYVMIPVYNVERYLRACLDSVLAQTMTDYDVVLVDDGSKDQSGTICDEYAAKRPNFHVIHKANGGLLSARDAGVRYIREIAQEEDFIAFIDSDDVVKPDFLKCFRDAAVKDGSDIVFCKFVDLLPNGREVPSNPPEMPVGTIEDKREFYRVVFNNWGYLEIPRKAVSLRMFDDFDLSPYYRIRLGEDLVHSAIIFRKCQKASFLPDITYAYRQNPSSLTNTSTFENYKPYFENLRFTWNMMQDEGVWQEDDYTYFLRNFCALNVRWSIWMIAKFLVPARKKIAVYKTMQEDFIYSKTFAAAPKYAWDFKFIEKGWFLPICILGDMLGIARFFYRKIKRILLSQY